MNVIRHEVWIDASRETVFEAITSQQGLDGWWGKVVNAQPEIGSIVEFDHGHGDLLRMRILDLVPGKRVEWKCITDFSDPRNPGSEWLGTRLRFELEDAGRSGFGPLDAHFSRDQITILQFRHMDWPDNARWFAFCNYAWGITLGGLAEQCMKQESVEEI